MKLGILTQPPKMGQNYGCILQAYALQTKLNELGHESEIIDLRAKNKTRSLLYKCISVFVRIFKRYILNNKKYPKPFDQWDFTEEIRNYIYKNTLDFVDKHLITTEQIEPRGKGNVGRFISSKFDGFIVGSDQVWRPGYVYNLPIYFLDFVKEENVKRIAYAASFGVAENEYNDEMINLCKPLAQKFDAISVREDSGVKLCKELFDVEAVHVIDPTMFFDSEHYIKLSKERNDYFNDGDCFTYILDKSSEKQSIVDRICIKYKLKPFNVMAKAKFKDVGPKHIDDCIMQPVEQWLDGFNKAKFVVTDSFHGTVFSILFKKPFITIGNADRGMARFDSLLRMFHLENRLIHSEKELTEELLNSEINFEAVHEILARERKKAEMFLIEALS